MPRHQRPIALLISLLAFPLLALIIPELNIAAIHPVSLLLLIAYFFGLRLISEARAEPMWRPLHTAETRLDIPEEAQSARGDVIKLWGRFLFYAVVVGFAGYVVAKVGVTIAGRTRISETFVGGVFTAVVTSLPELVTSLAAVRQGALTLAVGGVIGGNCFDVLFVAFSDIAFRSGSIYTLLTTQQLFIIVLSILMTSVLLLGMLRREKHGIGNIGFESFLIIVLYFGAFTLLFFKS